MGEETRRFYEFGPFRIDAAERMLLRDGQPVPLTPKAFDALLLLVESGGRTIETNDLMNRLWPESFVEEGNLKVTIFKLRKALGESSDREQYIETIPRRGYRFVAPVKESEEPGIRLMVEKRTTSHVLIEQEEERIEQPAESTPARQASASRRFTPLKKALAVVALVVALGAAIVCYKVLSGMNEGRRQSRAAINSCAPVQAFDGRRGRRISRTGCGRYFDNKVEQSEPGHCALDQRRAPLHRQRARPC